MPRSLDGILENYQKKYYISEPRILMLKAKSKTEEHNAWPED